MATKNSGGGFTIPSTSDLGGRLRAERERLKFTVEQVADQCGITVSVYNRHERETTLPASLLIPCYAMGMSWRRLLPELAPAVSATKAKTKAKARRVSPGKSTAARTSSAASATTPAPRTRKAVTAR
jgi:hypothetical protein